MMTEFTPVASLLGGALIGAATVWLMASTGRIAGISGILASIFPPKNARTYSALTFLVGMLLAAPIYHLATGGAPVQAVSENLPLLAIAGLLVGFGTVLGNGCTSGHGICGISLFSMRSILATLTFMAVAILTVYVTRHVIGG